MADERKAWKPRGLFGASLATLGAATLLSGFAYRAHEAPASPVTAEVLMLPVEGSAKAPGGENAVDPDDAARSLYWVWVSAGDSWVWMPAGAAEPLAPSDLAAVQGGAP